MARYSSTEAALSPGRRTMAVPSVAARTTSCPARRPASTTLAATETARSSERPACALRRRSRTTAVARGRGCSSWRTTSSPVRADDRQCTRRRSSPGRYSRRPRKLSRRGACTICRLRTAAGCSRPPGGGLDAVHAGVDDDLDRAADGQPPPGQAERVRAERLQRPDAEDAPPAGGQAVGGLTLLAGTEGGQAHACAHRPGHRVAEREHRGGDAAPVGHRQLHPGALADVEPGRPHGPADAQGEAPDPDQQHGDQDEGDHAGAQREQLQPAEEPAQQHGARAEADDGPSGAGGHTGYLAAGTGTLARTSSTTPVRLTPRTPASSLRISRWASTGPARTLTSSGMT